MRGLIRWCVLLLVIGGLGGTLHAQKRKPTAKRPVRTKPKPKFATFQGRPLIEAGRKPVNNKALNLPEPEYPNNPQTARIKKAVIKVEIFISGLGEVLAAKAISGPRVLRQAAEEAALRAKFAANGHLSDIIIRGFLVYQYPATPKN